MRVVAIVVATGVLLGVAGRASDYAPIEIRFFLGLGAPWVLAALAVGATTRRLRDAALAGAAALALAVAVYYAIRVGVEHRNSAHYSLSMTILWGGLGIACGALFGAAGGALRGSNRRARELAIALVGGTLAGEAALYIAIGRDQPEVLGPQLAAGLLIPLLCTRPMRRAVPVATAAAAIAFAALTADAGLRILARMGGWGG